MKTTLNKIKSKRPCVEGWEKLLTFLNKTESDDEKLDLLTILESNGLRDALWALKCVEGKDKEIRLMACDFAESVVYLTNDERSVNAIKISRDYANGLATQKELKVAKYAAWDARDAARDAAWSAALFARDAAWDACKKDILKMQQIYKIEEMRSFFVHSYVIHRSCMNDFLIKYKNK